MIAEMLKKITNGVKVSSLVLPSIAGVVLGNRRHKRLLGPY
jgi:hypothetical protein